MGAIGLLYTCPCGLAPVWLTSPCSLTSFHPDLLCFGSAGYVPVSQETKAEWVGLSLRRDCLCFLRFPYWSLKSCQLLCRDYVVAVVVVDN